MRNLHGLGQNLQADAGADPRVAAGPRLLSHDRVSFVEPGKL